MACMLFAAGCSVFSSDEGGRKRDVVREEPTAERQKRAEAVLIQEIDEAMDAEIYSLALKNIEEFQSLYPLSEKSAEIGLTQAEAFFRAGRFKEAVEAFDTFQSAYPGHPKVAYAYLMKAKSHKERYGDHMREQLPLEKAEKEVQTLVKKFPNSDYSKEAQQLLGEIVENKALHQFEVANYYISSGNLEAAAPRVRKLIAEYKGSTAHNQLEATINELGAEDWARLKALTESSK